jgi:hypothetical protein
MTAYRRSQKVQGREGNDSIKKGPGTSAEVGERQHTLRIQWLGSKFFPGERHVTISRQDALLLREQQEVAKEDRLRVIFWGNGGDEVTSWFRVRLQQTLCFLVQLFHRRHLCTGKRPFSLTGALTIGESIYVLHQHTQSSQMETKFTSCSQTFSGQSFGHQG